MKFFQAAILLSDDLKIGRGDGSVTDITGEERCEGMDRLESGALGEVEVADGRDGEGRGEEKMSDFIAEVEGEAGEGRKHRKKFTKKFVVNGSRGDDGELLQGRGVTAAERQDLRGAQDIGQRESLEKSRRRREVG